MILSSCQSQQAFHLLLSKHHNFFTKGVTKMVTTEEASKRLNISKQSLRLWLRSGHCPFGDAFKGRGESYQYIISEKRLDAWINGIDINKGAPYERGSAYAEMKRG